MCRAGEAGDGGCAQCRGVGSCHILVNLQIAGVLTACCRPLACVTEV